MRDCGRDVKCESCRVGFEGALPLFSSRLFSRSVSVALSAKKMEADESEMEERGFWGQESKRDRVRAACG